MGMGMRMGMRMGMEMGMGMGMRARMGMGMGMRMKVRMGMGTGMLSRSEYMGCFQTHHPWSEPCTKPAVLLGLLWTCTPHPTCPPPPPPPLLWVQRPAGVGGNSPRQPNPARRGVVLHCWCVPGCDTRRGHGRAAPRHREGDGALGEDAPSSHCPLGAQPAAKASSAPSISPAPTHLPPKPRGAQHCPPPGQAEPPWGARMSRQANVISGLSHHSSPLQTC